MLNYIATELHYRNYILHAAVRESEGEMSSATNASFSHEQWKMDSIKQATNDVQQSSLKLFEMAYKKVPLPPSSLFAGDSVL